MLNAFGTPVERFADSTGPLAWSARVKRGILIPFLIAAGSVAGHAQTAPPPSFAKTVVPVLRKAGCPACHNHDGVASGTRVIFPEADASAAELDRFGLSLQAVVDRSAPEKSLLLMKPTKRIAHAGGQRIKPGSPEENVVATWANYLAKIPQVEQHATLDGPAQKQRPVLRDSLIRNTTIRFAISSAMTAV